MHSIKKVNTSLRTVHASRILFLHFHVSTVADTSLSQHTVEREQPNVDKLCASRCLKEASVCH